MQHYLVIDFEATCCDRNSIPRDESEIIEIGAVMVDAQSLAPVSEFATFVQPVLFPTLTRFCIELTSITQADVEDAPCFAEAIAAMRSWADGYADFLFCSWGDYDRKQLRRQCQQSQVDYPFGEGHLNLKAEFSHQLGTRRRFGMAAALRKVGIRLEGTHHRGIDDARNIAKLLPHIVSPTQ